MKFSNLAMALGLMASHAVATPIDDSVERGELTKASEVSELDRRQCAACGVYLCAGKDFTGECYWGCYPPRTLIEVDSYWRTHIASVGPDRGCYCTLGTPELSSCQGFEYPGGNLEKNACWGNVGNFYCVPT
ncbi:hypothetical protein QBC33DRAFT_536686 [Phialemonium atrogriseum]|uniref:Uncharacterized protein n=1 Tax=Phialemonium atrogriseum TaxID=1093897 RepID=A0AAJ0C1M6_9PEZI|nr:uncharacterized protein QBC33DRAFT_536686 [Phialemonium atrogriseum]KAK1768265.1 hypothetical protein QBC33DRAFT_536686 [Phialemonium atrogriseum]